MTDTIMVETGTSTREIVIDDVTYPAYNGIGYISGEHANEVKRSGENWAPMKSWSLAGSHLIELKCTSCGRKKLACFGPVCAWCGGEAVSI